MTVGGARGIIDCDDERLEGRYMETRRRHFRQGPPDWG
jgi:hypothetical protein